MPNCCGMLCSRDSSPAGRSRKVPYWTVGADLSALGAPERRPNFKPPIPRLRGPRSAARRDPPSCQAPRPPRGVPARGTLGTGGTFMSCGSTPWQFRLSPTPKSPVERMKADDFDDACHRQQGSHLCKVGDRMAGDMCAFNALGLPGTGVFELRSRPNCWSHRSPQRAQDEASRSAHPAPPKSVPPATPNRRPTASPFGLRTAALRRSRAQTRETGVAMRIRCTLASQAHSSTVWSRVPRWSGRQTFGAGRNACPGFGCRLAHLSRRTARLSHPRNRHGGATPASTPANRTEKSRGPPRPHLASAPVERRCTGRRPAPLDWKP